MLILSDETRQKLEAAHLAVVNALNEDAMGGNYATFDTYLNHCANLLEMVNKDERQRRAQGGRNA